MSRSVDALWSPDRQEDVVALPPHDKLDKLAEAGDIETGINLYRCRVCDSWWEYEEWTYFPERSLRRIRPVAALEHWRAQHQQRMKPPSALFGSLLLFIVGLLVIAGFAGLGWLVNTLFSIEMAN
jgi:hypothetical protein